MKQISLIFLVTIFTCLGCANSQKENYKYTDKDDLLSCSEVDMVLIKEAVYAFEDFIAKHYTYNNQVNLQEGYLNFLHNANMGLIPKVEFFDDHIRTLFLELKEHTTLWNTNQNSLDYNGEIIKCISSQIKDKTTQNVYDALTSSNTMRTEIYSASLGQNIETLLADEALRTYVALDMFYAKFLGLDFNLSQEQLIKEVSRINREIAGHKAH